MTQRGNHATTHLSRVSRAPQSAQGAGQGQAGLAARPRKPGGRPARLMGGHDDDDEDGDEVVSTRKGANGVCTNGVTANFMFFDGLFAAAPLVLTPFVYKQSTPSRRGGRSASVESCGDGRSDSARLAKAVSWGV